MNRCDIPLTEDQRRTAEQHIDVVDKFMRSKRVDKDYWDVVIFGYLTAVRNYCERRELQENYHFDAIAWTHMKCSLRSELKKSCYHVIVISLDAPVNSCEDLMRMDCGITSCDEDFTVPDVEAILSLLETDEQEIVRYLYLGYSREETAKLLGITVSRSRRNRGRQKRNYKKARTNPEWRLHHYQGIKRTRLFRNRRWRVHQNVQAQAKELLDFANK